MKKQRSVSGIFATVLAGMLALMSFGVFAQHGTGTGGGYGGGFGNASPEDRAKRITGMMKDQLKLNADQEKKTYAINLKYAKLNEEAKKKGNDDEIRKAVQSNNKERDNELKGVFTAEQFKSYQKILEERKARQKNRD